ncbi:uncharacterized protein METZ01_LOCUS221398, partial [marine metagenome]
MAATRRLGNAYRQPFVRPGGAETHTSRPCGRCWHGAIFGHDSTVRDLSFQTETSSTWTGRAPKIPADLWSWYSTGW